MVFLEAGNFGGIALDVGGGGEGDEAARPEPDTESGGKAALLDGALSTVF